jgi:voltage-gated potassium channel Kch
MLYNYNPTDKENRPTMIWMSLMFVAIYWTAVEAPITFVLDYAIEEYNLWWDGLFSAIFFTDIFLRLRNKLKLPSPHKFDFEKVHHEVEERPYHKSLWLPVDIFTSLPFDIIVSFFGLSLPTKIVSALRLLRIIRIVKLRSLVHLIDHVPKSIKVVLAISGVMLIIHWISCGWMLLNPRTDLDPYSFYNVSLYWTVTTLTTVGYGDITPQTNLARLYTMGVMLIGVASYGIIIGNFSRMIMLKDRYEEERKEKMNGLQKYMRFYNIPHSLQRQVFSFYNHLLNQNISDQDHQVVNELPQALQNELQIYMKIKLIKAVHIFQDCTTPCLKMIAQKLEQTYHSPNEYIIKKGDVGDEMFILGHGEVEVTMGEKVLTTLKAGQFFGEIALLEDTIRTADVKTKAYCDLYTFKKTDFLEVISKYPDLGDKFRNIYTKRKTDNEKNIKNAA